jgi:hypothetical protein
MLLWSISKRLNDKCHYPDKLSTTGSMIMKKVISKSSSMKPRGLAFAVEAISLLPTAGDDEFNKLEKVVLSKIKEFIPHYYIKIMLAFSNAGQGSGELFS